ncbi:MAG: hypothetical protein ATN35_05950 [Epulopiscium sp. Nele67-Bin004]|nr:MAG: hypothetical protein ATN35_05950 [Epulopiscium sp. Nele67-Bin004]
MKSLQLKLTAMLGGYLAFLIMLTITISHIFLGDFYIHNKEKVLEQSYLYIKEIYNGDILEIQEDLYNIQDKNNMIIYIYTSSEGIIYPYNYEGNKSLRTDIQDVDIRQRLPQNLRELLPDKNETFYESFLSLEEMWEFENDVVIIQLNTPVSAIQETTDVISRFFSMIGVAVGIVGVSLVFFISKRITKPIVDINNVAKEITTLNFDNKLNVTSQDELGQLANTINILSQQLQQRIVSLEDDIKNKDHQEEVRKQFIANVSHELKTPLALILGYTQGLKLGLDKQSQDFYCEVIEDESVKMTKLVSKLLEISQIEAGGINLQKEEFDFVDLIREVGIKNSLPLAEKEIEYIENISSCTIYADYDYIDQVVTNYITNAITHVNVGGTIEVTAVEDEGFVTLTVYNSGSHISEEDISSVWDSFYKVNKARTREYGGHGLGLYIVKMVMEIHGGTYFVENIKAGVQFGIKLPKG